MKIEISGPEEGRLVERMKKDALKSCDDAVQGRRRAREDARGGRRVDREGGEGGDERAERATRTESQDAPGARNAAPDLAWRGVGGRAGGGRAGGGRAGPSREDEDVAEAGCWAREQS